MNLGEFSDRFLVQLEKYKYLHPQKYFILNAGYNSIHSGTKLLKSVRGIEIHSSRKDSQYLFSWLAKQTKPEKGNAYTQLMFLKVNFGEL